jgi:phenylalanyl-tRNA synthetase beta subunit
VAVYVGLDDTFATLRGIVDTLHKEGKLPNLSKKPERPFDEFVNQKLGKKSLAFRLIFQSFEKTLTDAEVNAQMEHIYSKLKSHEGWQIR